MLQLARAEDREAVNALACQVHDMHVRWRPDIYAHCDCLYPEARFASAVEAKQLYVAKADGVVVGYVLLPIGVVDHPAMVKRKIMKIEEICVHEAVRHQGIGRQMMEDIHALAKAFGCTDLQLGVYPQNDDAVGLYQKCGFTIRSIEMQRKV